MIERYTRLTTEFADLGALVDAGALLTRVVADLQALAGMTIPASVTIDAAAAHLGITPGQVRRLIRSGALHAYGDGKSRQVDLSTLRASRPDGLHVGGGASASGASVPPAARQPSRAHTRSVSRPQTTGVVAPTVSRSNKTYDPAADARATVQRLHGRTAPGSSSTSRRRSAVVEGA